LGIILFSGFTSAFSSFDPRADMENLIRIIIDISQPALQAVLGEYWSGADMLLFEKFLLFAILIAVTYVGLSKAPFFKNGAGEIQKGVVWTISLAIPILAVRYIPLGWMDTLLITYSAFGIAMTTFVPLVIYFFFLQGLGDEFPSAMRKIAWILFICIYLGLYSTTDRENYSEWYFLTAIAALLFLLFDGTIHRYFRLQKLKALGAPNIHEHIKRLQDLQKNVDGFYTMDPEEKKIEKKKYQKQIDYWMKELSK
jgi:hypothetical protein